MKPETTISLVKELEKIKSIRARNSYFGAWCGLLVGLIWLGSLYLFTFEKEPVKSLGWFPSLMFTLALMVLLQSFYIIIRYLMNRKFSIIIESLLENKKSD